MEVESVITTLFVMLLYVLKPGPSILAMVSRSLSDGFIPGFLVALGNTTAHIIYFLLAFFGYALVEIHLEFATFFLKSIGVVYVLYIGIKGLLHLDAGYWGGKPDVQTKIKPVEHYFSGLVICLSSPYTILFYIAIIPQILPLKNFAVIDVMAATVLIAGTYLSMHALIAYLCSSARTVLKKEKFVRRVNFLVSITFIGIGLFFFLTMFPLFQFNL